MAFVSTGLTLLFRMAIDEPLHGQPTLVIFTIPIMFSAYVGGLKGGLCATILTHLAASYYLLPPLYNFGIATGAARWQQLFLALAGVFISLLNEALHRVRARADDAVRAYQGAEAALRQAHDELEARVERRTALLAQSNAELAAEITERQRAETELVAARETADAANLAKSEFLSRISHELRTPLNAILGFGQILAKQPLSAIGEESVSHILKGGRQLLELVNEVLDISSVEAGQVELSLQPVALHEIVPETCALMAPLAAERGIKLTCDAGPGYSGHVLADRQRLKQVLINLLSNAIKYNRPDGSVHVSCYPASEDWTCVTVRDTGPGIEVANLPKLFAPFERLNADGSDTEGTGLGLVLSQRLVAAMGGTLAVESTVGEGTSFTIALPPAGPPQANPETTGAAGPAPGEQKHWTVLCIEDNPSNLRLLEVMLLGRPDIHLLTAIQGSIGLDMARQHTPHLILLDLNLPDMHGREVLEKLQGCAETRDIPVIIVTADATTGRLQQLLDAGARSYLTKPLDVDQFLATLDQYLRGDAGAAGAARGGKENVS